MSRSCHSAMFSSPTSASARSRRAMPRHPLGEDRIALVRHGARSLLPRAERLERLAHLGALEVPDLDRRSAPASRRGWRAPSAARRDGHGSRPGSVPDRRRGRARRGRGARPPRSRSRASRPRPRSSRPRSARAPAPAGSRRARSSAYQPATLNPNVIGSAWMPWLRPTIGVARCWRARRRTTSTSRASSRSTTARRVPQRSPRWPCRGRRSWSGRSGASGPPVRAARSPSAGRR